MMNTIEDRMGKTLDEVAGKRGDFVVGVASWNEGMVIQLASDQEIDAGDLKGDIIVKDLGNSNENINTEKLRSNCNRALKVKKAKGMALKKGKTHAFLRKDLQIVDPVSVWPELKHRLEGRKRYEDVTLDTIEKYMLVYITDFERINDMERYKWRAIKHFQKHWDIEAEDFSAMLIEALSQTDNLLASANYAPRVMMGRMVNAAPEEVRQAFAELYDLRSPLTERVGQFIKTSKLINDTHEIEGDNSYQDARAAIVYLSFRYPEKYYLYKYNMFVDASRKLELAYSAKTGAVGVVPFLSACEFIKSRLIKNDELLALHYERLGNDCYHDPNLTVLTQDFIYAVAQHLPNFVDSEQDTTRLPTTLPEVKDMSELAMEDTSDIPSSSGGKGVKLDYDEKTARQRAIGKEGERLIVEREKRFLIENGRADLAGKVEWTSAMQGDGAGYDIESRTLKGKVKYIEVKTTTGYRGTPFYFSRNELLVSEEHKKQYYLYRVYELDEETGEHELDIYHGSLKVLNAEPWSFRVKGK